MLWNDEMDSELRDLFSKGLSYTQIASVMNRKFQTVLTRNATIGRSHRLNLQGTRTEERPRSRKHISTEPKPVRAKRPPMIKAEFIVPVCVEVPVKPRHITLQELSESVCKYPYGDEPPYTFCGHPSKTGKPYCSPHWNVTNPPRS